MERVNLRGNLVKSEMEKGRGGSNISPFPIALEPSFELFSHRNNHAITPDHPIKNDDTLSRINPPILYTIRVRPAREGKWHKELGEQFLVSCSTQISFEIMCFKKRIMCQVASLPEAIPAISSSLSMLYPNSEVFAAEDLLKQINSNTIVASTYRLKSSHFFPLKADFKIDPYYALLGALSSLTEDQFGALQIIFTVANRGWRDNILLAAKSEFNPEKSVFYDLPDLLKLAEKKANKLIFAVSIRLAGSNKTIISQMEGLLNQYEGDNGFIALDSEYPVSSIFQRTVHSTGMLLNAEELASLVHVPEIEEASTAIDVAMPGAIPPESATKDYLVNLGTSTYHGVMRPVGISEEAMTRHVAIFGSTGTGKTTLLLRFVSLVNRGYGMAFIDPHGDAAEAFLSLIPENRIKDCIYFNPGDRDYPPSLNILESSDEREKQMLCSDLLVSLTRLFKDSWGPRMEWILRQCINTLLYSNETHSLRDINKLLFNEQFRAKVLTSVQDPDILSFWSDNYPKLPKGSFDPIVNKISKFVDNPLVRNIISQPNLIDFQEIVRTNKIFIANLSKGILGEDVAFLLGSFILSKLQIATMSRAELSPADRKLYTIVIDEFQNYADDATNSSSIISLFSEARKYKVSFIVATQFLSQLHKDVVAAIFGNIGTLIAFRCGTIDAQFLQKEFGVFTSEDILDLAIFKSIVRMQKASASFIMDISPPHKTNESFKSEVVSSSRRLYCRPRNEVEQLIRQPRSIRNKATLSDIPDEINQRQKAFLEFILNHPGLSITQIYAQMELSAYMGNRIKKELIDHGFLVEQITNLGAGSRVEKLLIPTVAASKLISSSDLAGRGSILHKFIQSLIKNIAIRKNYTALIEAQITESGKSIDVLLEKEGKKIAVEISLFSKEENEVANIRRCLDNNFNNIQVVCVDSNHLISVRKLADETMSKDESEKVRFCLLNDFWSIL